MICTAEMKLDVRWCTIKRQPWGIELWVPRLQYHSEVLSAIPSTILKCKLLEYGVGNNEFTLFHLYFGENLTYPFSRKKIITKGKRWRVRVYGFSECTLSLSSKMVAFLLQLCFIILVTHGPPHALTDPLKASIASCLDKDICAWFLCACAFINTTHFYLSPSPRFFLILL